MAVLWQLGVQFIQGYFVNAPEEVVMAEGQGRGARQPSACVAFAASSRRCCCPRRVRRGRAEPPRVERNVVYGMYSGLALLLDVHRPAKPNGFGVVFISGSGWQAVARLRRRAAQGTADRPVGSAADSPPGTPCSRSIIAAAPRFHYPAAIDDVQRAIRFVRAHARDYGIDGARLGGVGGSSGGNLIGLAAMLAAPGIQQRCRPRESRVRGAAGRRAARGRCSICARIDTRGRHGLRRVVHGSAASRTPRPRRRCMTPPRPSRTWRSRAPPMLLLHGDADKLMPFEQSVAMEAALRSAKVPVQAGDDSRAASMARISAPRSKAQPTGRTTSAKPSPGSTATCAASSTLLRAI